MFGKLQKVTLGSMDAYLSASAASVNEGLAISLDFTIVTTYREARETLL